MKKYLIRAVFLTISFICVIYSIRSLNSGKLTASLQDPANPLAVLIGSNHQPTNWCPDEVQKIEMFRADGSLERTFTFAIEFSVICEIMITPVPAADLDISSFSKYLTARGALESQEVELKANPARDVFELKGYYFSSPMLVKAVERVTKE